MPELLRTRKNTFNLLPIITFRYISVLFGRSVQYSTVRFRPPHSLNSLLIQRDVINSSFCGKRNICFRTQLLINVIIVRRVEYIFPFFQLISFSVFLSGYADTHTHSIPALDCRTVKLSFVFLSRK